MSERPQLGSGFDSRSATAICALSVGLRGSHCLHSSLFICKAGDSGEVQGADAHETFGLLKALVVAIINTLGKFHNLSGLWFPHL